ncbi:potassium-transporting ATPase subunit KdpA [Lacipirellula parvula]|uniref:Potassium-transporting ATPase potassium-binding subunit n=1 Tax=Lacipirellula parvula TaxID=2650471 RepID=A0A5K7X606_9BACT|nr:potassium-transporting ATPase subunit KdpA [Lacipirellula parvula]BBO31242.1 potassium-transporting ATPase A chain [Lacipirellula parvula]
MNVNAWIQFGLFVAVLAALAKPLGAYMARVLEGKPGGLERLLGWCERGIYRIAGVDVGSEMGWRQYAFGVMAFNLIGIVAVYAVLRLQGALPLNPQEFPGATPDLAFDTAVSFASNTNWQSYGGETTLSYLSQAFALTVQNFVSAATGIAVLAALIRGLVRRTSTTIGNFWVDLVRSTLYILLPLSVIWAVALVSQGVIQNFDAYKTVELAEPIPSAEGDPTTTQLLAMGPVASQVAIKQLGTNGGGFFNVNSAHPFENPTPLSNFLQVLAILLIPAALCCTFGVMVGDVRQGWAIFAAMLVIFLPLTLGVIVAEQSGVPQYAAMGADDVVSDAQSGGNMEGKETRFGIVNSAIWASATTAASNGSVNAMHDSFTPLGGLIPMWLMQLGEIIFGGVGSGLYGMLMFAIVAVFIAGLMVGRTPEYLGKKIEAFEMKMASLVILIPCCMVLVGTAIAVAGPGLAYLSGEEVKGNLNNPGAHGFSEVLYALSSAGNNNGSAFAGLTANEPFYNVLLGIAMFASRYWLIIPVLAIAGSLARKKYSPPSAGTLPTHQPLFVVMLVCTVLLVGALTFVPALALGPVVEHLQMIAS